MRRRLGWGAEAQKAVSGCCKPVTTWTPVSPRENMAFMLWGCTGEDRTWKNRWRSHPTVGIWMCMDFTFFSLFMLHYCTSVSKEIHISSLEEATLSMQFFLNIVNHNIFTQWACWFQRALVHSCRDCYENEIMRSIRCINGLYLGCDQPKILIFGFYALR